MSFEFKLMFKNNPNGPLTYVSILGVPAAGPQANLHNKMPEQAGADYGHQSGAAASSGQYAGAAASSGQYAGAAASSGHGSPMMVHNTKTNYDQIFDVRGGSSSGFLIFT